MQPKKVVKGALAGLPLVGGYYYHRYFIKYTMTSFGEYLSYVLSDRKVYWSVHRYSTIAGVRNILVGHNDAPGKAPGCYIQGINGIIMGGYNLLAPNVGLISANHDFQDIKKHSSEKPILIGRGNWIGMGAVILPGIQIGDNSVIGAGAIVTRDVPSNTVVVGNPARAIKELPPQPEPFVAALHNSYGYVTDKTKRYGELKERRREMLAGYRETYGEILSDALKSEIE